jgi:hypothetical protein
MDRALLPHVEFWALEALEHMVHYTAVEEAAEDTSEEAVEERIPTLAAAMQEAEAEVPHTPMQHS